MLQQNYGKTSKIVHAHRQQIASLLAIHSATNLKNSPALQTYEHQCQCTEDTSKNRHGRDTGSTNNEQTWSYQDRPNQNRPRMARIEFRKTANKTERINHQKS